MVGDTEEPASCPVQDCELCVVPGECDDCLDCLLGPGVSPEPTPDPRRPVSCGDRLPSRSAELRRVRGSLTVADAVGLLLREHRRLSRRSQRAVAAELGLSKSALGRAESHPGRLTLEAATQLMTATGHRLALLDAQGREVDVTRWGVGELLARDAGGRRLPAHSELVVDIEHSRQARSRSRYLR